MSEIHFRIDELEAQNQELIEDIDRLQAENEQIKSMNLRWKKAVEGLTPNGSEFVNDPEACAAHIKERTRWPKQILEARAENERLRERVGELEGAIKQAAEEHAKIHWGWDGDSGSGEIISELENYLDLAAPVVAKEGEETNG